MALLGDMIYGQGKAKAAKALGVNYRTLVRPEESGQLTARMSAELERHLLLGGGSAAAQQRESMRALGERVEVLEERLGSGLEDLREKATAEVREGGSGAGDAAVGAAGGEGGSQTERSGLLEGPGDG